MMKRKKQDPSLLNDQIAAEDYRPMNYANENAELSLRHCMVDPNLYLNVKNENVNDDL